MFIYLFIFHCFFGKCGYQLIKLTEHILPSQALFQMTHDSL